ncbi:MAG: hypothetical protein H6905_09540 [Hyphomicrobiales bacterium]|nr:hypothetical protein [Hyphomicrobiales bacterium]
MAAIIGSHLPNAAEIAALNRMIDSGAVRVPVPFLGEWSELPRLHQAMWENRLPEMTDGATKAVVCASGSRDQEPRRALRSLGGSTARELNL